MGCSQSNEANQPNTTPIKPVVRNYSSSKARDYQCVMIGNSSTNGMVLGFDGSSFQPIVSRKPIPRYSNALLLSKKQGFITGGIEDLQSNINIKATIDAQIFQGVVSKKCIFVNMQKLVVDPQSSFQMMPDMINARYAHCMAHIDGYLYVIGGRQYGEDQNGLLSACQRFDISSKKWKPIPSLQYPRSAAGIVIYGQHIYVFGGYSGHNTRTRCIQSYSSGDSGWRKLPFDLHEGIQGPLLIKKPGTESSVLIFGGKTNNGKTNRVTNFNLDKSTIAHLSSMKQERCFHKGKVIGDQIFLIGGGSENVQIYDIHQQSSYLNKDITYLEFCSVREFNSFSQFSQQIQLKPTKKKLEKSPFAKKTYLFGHAGQPFSKVVNLQNFVVMSEGQSLFHNFYLYSTVVKVNKESCFVMGGINADYTQVCNTVYNFSLMSEQIKYLQPMITARYAFSSCVLGSYLYVIGGRKIGDDQTAILNQCERFSFESYHWETIPTIKYKRQSSTAVAISNYIVLVGGYKGNNVRSNEIEVFLETQNRWVQIDQKFDLSVQSMTPISFHNQIYLFGGRAEQTDIQKTFKMKINIDEGLKYEKFMNIELEPVGNLSYPGCNLKISTSEDSGLIYIFGNIESGIDVYDLNSHQIVQTQKLNIFEKLSDRTFQSYTLIS